MHRHPRSLTPFVRVALLACVVAPASCGGEPPPPPVVAKPTPPAPKPPPKAEPTGPARWVFDESGFGIRAKLDLGAQGVLYVGQSGRRAIGKGDAPMTHATTLAIDDLVGVLKDASGKFLFVADDGDVHVANDALGPIVSTRPGPLPAATKVEESWRPPKFRSVTTGKASILGLTNDGALMRSADGGTTWAKVDLGAKIVGKAVNVALDSQGKGLLMVLPQRAFVTSDDGATWSPIPTPGIGGSRIERDGEDRIFLSGGGGRARLENGKLAVTKDFPTALYQNAKTKWAPGKGWKRHTPTIVFGANAGKLVVSHDGPNTSIELSVGKLGEAPKVSKLADLEGGVLKLDRPMAGYGNELVIARGDDDDGTTTLFRSTDAGSTWKKDEALDGVEKAWTERVELEAGPQGWTYVGSLCPTGSYGEKECQLRKIRPAGAKAFEDLAAVESFVPQKFAFDAAHSRVYVLGRTNDNHHRVYESKLTENKFSRTKFVEESYDASARAMTVDEKGTVRIMMYAQQHWTLHRLDADGSLQAPLSLALGYGEADLHGRRGLALTSGDRAWETADGGETWVRVGSHPWARFDCGEPGCVLGGTQRIGWDLPMVEGAEKIVGSTTPPEKKTWTPGAPDPLPATAMRCKETGPWSNTLEWTPPIESVDLNASDARWGQAREESDGRVFAVVGSKTGAPKELLLINALPKPAAKPKDAKDKDKPEDTVVTGTHSTSSDRGVIGARYSYVRKAKGTGEYSPVDVEFAWWSAQTNKVVKHSVKGMKAFRVSRAGFSGFVSIVEGGLIFQPFDAQNNVATFFRDDGKREEITFDRPGWNNTILRVGKKWIAASAGGGEAALAWSDDAKTWTKKFWGISDDYPSLSVGVAAGKPLLESMSSKPGGPAWSFPIDAMLDDPPAPSVLDLHLSAPRPMCDAKAGGVRTTVGLPAASRDFHVLVTDGDPKTATTQTFVPTRMIMHADAANTCVAAYEMRTYSPHLSTWGTVESGGGYLFPDSAKAQTLSGWMFKRNSGPGSEKGPRYAARPYSCALEVKKETAPLTPKK